MANFSEISGIKQWAVVLAGGVVVTVALYFTVFKTERDENAAAQQKLEAKLHENAELEAYRPKLAEIERQLVSLKQQLEIERRIVPDEKEVDGFMRLLGGEAQKAGVEIRRYTAAPLSAKDFYTEVPFEVELDGPFYSMLNFFDRVRKMERIVNVSGLLVASMASYEKNFVDQLDSSVFSHDIEPPASTAGGKSGQTPQPVKR